MAEESVEQRDERRINENLLCIKPEELSSFLRQHEKLMITESRPFADHMRRKIREKELLQQNVFLAADLSENYGYKLISEEKHTWQRDVILRLCFAARFTMRETDDALLRYGMAPLDGRLPRDAILLVAMNNGIYDIETINQLLEVHGCFPLLKDYH